LPDGFTALFAPAAALPALPPRPPLAVLAVVDPLVPVVLPLEVDPPAAAPPVEPVPLCAKANELVSTSAVASPMSRVSSLSPIA